MNSSSSPESLPYRHILVATDFSASASYAAQRAATLARLSDARLTVLHVMEAAALFDELGDGVTAFDLDTEQALESYAMDRLRQLRSAIELPTASIELLIGRPKTEVVDYAIKHDVDLVVLGSHGHSGLALLLGSTADGISHAAPCDVLAVQLPSATDSQTPPESGTSS